MAQNLYGGIAEGLESGARTGLLLGRAYRKGRDARRNTAMLNLEADLAGATPPALNDTQGALPLDTGQDEGENTDGRTGLAQGYAGNNVKAMWDNVRRAAAELGDPLAYADSEGRVLDILTQKFKAHMMSGANLLKSDPTAAVEEFAKASYWIPDGSVPTFNVITTPDGTPVVAHRAIDPETGKEKLTMLTPDMIQSIILTQGSMEQMVAGITGIPAQAAARYSAAMEKDVTAATGKRDFKDEVMADLDEALKEFTPDPGEITREVTAVTADGMGEVTTKETVPGAFQNSTNRGEARVAAEAIIWANLAQTREELARHGLRPSSAIDGRGALDMVRLLTDSMIAGNAPMTSMRLISEADGMKKFMYIGKPINIPTELLQDLARIANRVRKAEGYDPLPTIGEGASEAVPAPAAEAAPTPTPAPAAGIPTDVDPSVMGP